MRRTPSILRRCLLGALFRLLLVIAAYQLAPTLRLSIGAPGDRVFLTVSEGRAADDSDAWYGDELTPDSPTGRSRWTHPAAALRIPALDGAPRQLSVTAQGWPDDVIGTQTRQPTIAVLLDGARVGSFTPTPGWRTHTVALPARAPGDATIALVASDVFTNTQRYTDDVRPKGVRVATIALTPAMALGPTIPPGAPLLWLALVGALLGAALPGGPPDARRAERAAVALAALLLTLGALLARIWLMAALPAVALAALALLAWCRRGWIRDMVSALVGRYRRGSAIDYGLVAGGVSGAWYAAAQAIALVFPWLAGWAALIGGAAVAWLLVSLGRFARAPTGHSKLRPYGLWWHEGTPGRWSGWWGWALALALAGWLGWGWWSMAGQTYVGHADYADNAVVARNLVAGRGWVVDYVTQFYTLYRGVTRPQETWPLLQPVWIAPFFALFGPQAWAARLPNVVFSALLGWLIYRYGARWWDQRTGALAALLLLTNYLFFRLQIYTTSDLAFVAFAFAAMAGLVEDARPRDRETARPGERTATSATHSWRPLLIAGIWTGLMLLQKPGGGAMLALGIGLWLLWHGWADSDGGVWRRVRRALVPAAVWAGMALAILAPLLIYNMAVFGRPFHSTESTDAWVIGYTSWDSIYGVYTDEGGLAGGGAPDRSWLLRWGYDRVGGKIVGQIASIRDYLLPSWPGGPLDGALFSRPEKPKLLFDVLAWLAPFGVLAARRARGAARRLAGLLAAAYLPYAAFLVLYWHANEDRYWVALMPWIALYGCAALWRLSDALARRRLPAIGAVLVLAAAMATWLPSAPDVWRKTNFEPQLYAADIDAYAWIAANARDGEVTMTRAPWQLTWHSRRPALIVPNTTDRTTLLRLARYYGVRYLVFDSLQNPSPDVSKMLARMVADPQLGFREVHRSPVMRAVAQDGSALDLRTEIYAFPADYGGVTPIPADAAQPQPWRRAAP